MRLQTLERDPFQGIPPICGFGERRLLVSRVSAESRAGIREPHHL